MAIDFPLIKSVDKAFLTTVLTVDDYRSYDFIEKMELIKKIFGQSLTFAI